MSTGFGPICITEGSATGPCTPWQPTRANKSGFSPVVFTKSLETGYMPQYSGCRLGKLTKICRSEEHTSELQSRFDLVCRLLLEKKKKKRIKKRINTDSSPSSP